MKTLNIYHLWYRTQSCTAHKVFRSRDREHAIGVAKATAERIRPEYYSVHEGTLDRNPFFINELI